MRRTLARLGVSAIVAVPCVSFAVAATAVSGAAPVSSAAGVSGGAGVSSAAAVSGGAGVSGAAGGVRGVAAVHYACSHASSAKVACRFSTPSGNIRCLWTPRPNNVACELLATRRAYRLRPTGRAKAIKLRLAHRGETLPTSQLIVFPQSLSCRDTSRTMTCNQDFGLGEFRLARTGSRDR